MAQTRRFLVQVLAEHNHNKPLFSVLEMALLVFQVDG